MAWGQAGASGVADLVDRLVRDDAALSSLTILRFRKFGASEVSSLCEALKKNRTLTELNASGHQMSGETAKVVAEMLAANSTLTSLCVGDTNFGDAGVSGLAGGLRANTALRRLDLENKGISAAGAADLSAVLAESAVRDLLLQKNLLFAAGAEALFRGGACRLLTSLDLSFCGLDAAAAAHVAAGLLCAAPAATDSATDGARAGSPLQSLSLEGNPLGPGGVAEIASALAGAGGSLRDLNFAGTDAGDEGVRALAEGPLRACPKLRKLSLARCGAGSAAGEHLAAAVSAAGVSVDTLDLSGNSLGDAGATALAEALRDASSGPALSLDLTSNGISAASAGALGCAGRLRVLELFNNALGDSGAVALAEALTLSAAGCALCAPHLRPAPRVGARGHVPPFLWLALLAASSYLGGEIARLEYLNVGATGLGFSGVVSLFAAIRGGVAPALGTLEVSANEAAVSADGWDAELALVREARPALDVAWKAADSGVADAAGPPPEAVQSAMDAARSARAG